MEDKGVYWVLVVVGFLWISFLYGTGALCVCWVAVTTRNVCPDVKAAWNCVRTYEYTEKVWRPLALLLWYILWAASQTEINVYEESLTVYGPNVDKFSNDRLLFETRKKVQQKWVSLEKSTVGVPPLLRVEPPPKEELESFGCFGTKTILTKTDPTIMALIDLKNLNEQTKKRQQWSDIK